MAKVKTENGVLRYPEDFPPSYDIGEIQMFYSSYFATRPKKWLGEAALSFPAIALSQKLGESMLARATKDFKKLEEIGPLEELIGVINFNIRLQELGGAPLWLNARYEHFEDSGSVVEIPVERSFTIKCCQKSPQTYRAVSFCERAKKKKFNGNNRIRVCF